MINIWERQSVQGDLQPVMQKAQGKIATLYHSKGHALFISSRRDGEHQPGSFHYIGCAEDYLDNPDVFPGVVGKVVSKQEIKNAIGSDFDVIQYDWGYHVEYDPKN